VDRLTVLQFEIYAHGIDEMIKQSQQQRRELEQRRR
jgi:hypothetical protein